MNMTQVPFVGDGEFTVYQVNRADHGIYFNDFYEAYEEYAARKADGYILQKFRISHGYIMEQSKWNDEEGAFDGNLLYSENAE